MTDENKPTDASAIQLHASLDANQKISPVERSCRRRSSCGSAARILSNFETTNGDDSDRKASVTDSCRHPRATDHRSPPTNKHTPNSTQRESSASLSLFSLLVILTYFISVVSAGVAALDYKCPQECTCDSIANDRKQHVECNLLSVGDWSDFHAVQVNNTAWLTVRCDQTHMPSSLKPHVFSHLVELEQLELLDCAFSRLPARAFAHLNSLRRLVIATHDSRSSLQVDDGAFLGLGRLEQLELVDSNVKRLSDDELCRIGSTLRSLDLSGNLLTQLPAALTSSRNCLPQLQTLAMRTNMLKDNIIAASSSPAGFNSAAIRLEQLDLADNLLEQLPVQALQQFSSLKNLSLSGNKLQSIAETQFQTLGNLEHLDLSGNVMKSIPANAFQRLNVLRTLNLSRNSLSNQWISGQLLRNLLKLEQLDLSSNQLSQVDDNMLRHLLALRMLDMHGNRIESLNTRALEVLHNLERLDLSQNQLSGLPPLNGLYKLIDLNLADNVVRGLPGDFLGDAKQLVTLNLCGNQLVDLPSTLGGGQSNMQRLQTLRLCRNRFRSLPWDGFKTLTSLEHIDLSGNELSTWRFPGCLPDKLRLRTLDLSNNHLADPLYNISSLKSSPFNVCPALESLNLAQNVLSSLPDLRGAFPTLRTLNVSSNRLTTLEWSNMPSAMRSLTAASNQIVDMQSDPDKFCSNLELLDLQSNRITRLSPLPRGLRRLDARNNLISSFVAGVFESKPNLQEVHLEMNRIEQLEESDVRVTPSQNEQQPLPKLFLRDNPLQCHCSMTFLLDIGQRNSPQSTNSNSNAKNFDSENEISSPPQVPGPLYTAPRSMMRMYFELADFGQLECRDIQAGSFLSGIGNGGGSRTQPRKSLALINTTDMLCRYDEECDKKCYCCEYVACDCKKTCPEGCACYHDHDWRANIVDCSANVRAIGSGAAGGAVGLAAAFQTVPLVLPIDATEVRLDGNNFRVLREHSFLAKSRLQSLYLNSSNIGEIRQQAFLGLNNLHQLDLHDNSLRELGGHEFRELEHLQRLDLGSNQLIQIASATLANLTQLRFLSVRSNRLTDLTAVVLPEPAPSLEAVLMQHQQQPNSNNNNRRQKRDSSALRVDLANNPWDCACSEDDKRTGRFQAVTAWLDKFGPNIVRFITVQCLDGGGGAAANAEVRARTTTAPLVMRALALKERRCEMNYDEALQMLNAEAAKVAAAAAAAAAAASTEPSTVNDNNGSAPSSQFVDSKEISSSSGPSWLAGAFIGVGVAIVFVLIALGFIYRYELQVWTHSKFGCRLVGRSLGRTTNTHGAHSVNGSGGCGGSGLSAGAAGAGYDDTEERPYDAFISYSDADAAMVLGELVPRLELSQPMYRLYLASRDFRGSLLDSSSSSEPSSPTTTPRHLIIHAAKSSEAILQGGQQSKRAIVVISSSFLQREWSQLEYRTAHQQLFKDRRQKVIFICVDDVDVERRDLDVDLRISMKRHPCLKWGEKLFWKKLYFAMPDSTTNNNCANANNMNAALFNGATLPHHHQHLYHQTNFMPYQSNNFMPPYNVAGGHQLHHLPPTYQQQAAALMAAAAAAQQQQHQTMTMLPGGGGAANNNNFPMMNGFATTHHHHHPHHTPALSWQHHHAPNHNAALHHHHQSSLNNAGVVLPLHAASQQQLYGLSQHTYASGSATGVPSQQQHQQQNSGGGRLQQLRADSATNSTSTSGSSSTESDAMYGGQQHTNDDEENAVYASPAEIGLGQPPHYYQHHHPHHHYQPSHFQPALPPPNNNAGSSLMSPPSSTTPFYYQHLLQLQQQQQQQQQPPAVPPHHPAMFNQNQQQNVVVGGALASSASSASSSSAATAHSHTQLLSPHTRNNSNFQQAQQRNLPDYNNQQQATAFHQHHQHFLQQQQQHAMQQQLQANGLPITDL